jgi:hypothetical protein
MVSKTMHVIVDGENNVIAASAQAVMGENGVYAAMLPGKNQKMYKISNVPEHILNIRVGHEFHSAINKLFAEQFSNHKNGRKADIEEINAHDRTKPTSKPRREQP